MTDDSPWRNMTPWEVPELDENRYTGHMTNSTDPTPALPGLERALKPEDIKRANEIIAFCDFRGASSERYQDERMSHQYCAVKHFDKADRRDDFKWFMNWVYREAGYKAKFGKWTFRYYEPGDGYRYWVCWPVINRAPVTQSREGAYDDEAMKR